MGIEMYNGCTAMNEQKEGTWASNAPSSICANSYHTGRSTHAFPRTESRFFGVQKCQDVQRINEQDRSVRTP